MRANGQLDVSPNCIFSSPLGAMHLFIAKQSKGIITNGKMLPGQKCDMTYILLIHKAWTCFAVQKGLARRNVGKAGRLLVVSAAIDRYCYGRSGLYSIVVDDGTSLFLSKTARGGFLKIIPISIPTYAGMKIGFWGRRRHGNRFSRRRRLDAD